MSNNSSYKTNVYVVPDYSLSFDFIIRTNVVQQIILTIFGNDITTHKNVKNESMSGNFFINVTNFLQSRYISYY